MVGVYECLPHEGWKCVILIYVPNTVDKKLKLRRNDSASQF